MGMLRHMPSAEAAAFFSLGLEAPAAQSNASEVGNHSDGAHVEAADGNTAVDLCVDVCHRNTGADENGVTEQSADSEPTHHESRVHVLGIHVNQSESEMLTAGVSQDAPLARPDTPAAATTCAQTTADSHGASHVTIGAGGITAGWTPGACV